MYSQEQLSVYPYFQNVLKENNISVVLDSLTGLVARPYILGFIQSLIKEQTPFTFAILDLDNFKFINDTYGHKVGDGVLANVAADLSAHLSDYGLAGRFGGDEFLIVNLRDRTYAEKKAFYEHLYTSMEVLRKNIILPECQPFVTATAGSATYPDDAQDFDTLFSLIDKTLYRGKTKGRNCYIIYVEEKHKDIVIKDLKTHGLYATLHNIAIQCDLVPGPEEKLRAVYDAVKEDLRISTLYYIDEKKVLREVGNPTPLADVPDIGDLMREDIYSTNRLKDIEITAPALFKALSARDIETLLVAGASADMVTYGYLVCAEPHSLRIWQEDEYAILFFAARLLAASMRDA